MVYKAPIKIVGWLSLYQEDYLHSIYRLSRVGLCFELALLVICCFVMKDTKLEGLYKNYFIYVFPSHSLGCSTGAEVSSFKTASFPWLAGCCRLLVGPSPWAPDWAFSSSLLHGPVYMTRLDFSQPGRFTVVISYLMAGFSHRTKAETIGFLKS